MFYFPDEIEKAENNEGESEVRDAMINKCEYLTSIGNKAEALAALKQTLEKSNTTGLCHLKMTKYITTKNKWNFLVVRASSNLTARVDKSSIYFSGLFS